MLTFAKRCKKTQQWVLHPQAHEYTVVIPKKFQDLYSCADCIDGFILVVKPTNKMHCVPVGALGGPPHLVRENVTLGGMDSIWLEIISVI
jgi:hypothetical protein